MGACHRLSKGWLSSTDRGSPAIGVGRPLTEPPHHRLHVAGSGLDLDQSPVVLCPVCTKLMASPLFLCANQCQKAPFAELFHVFVFVTCKIMLSKYMWNLVNSKCICALRLPTSPLLRTNWQSDLIGKDCQHEGCYQSIPLLLCGLQFSL
jgi:hypothetical protein